MTKTTNYQLPKWEKTDRVQMKDFNDMTATLDAALKANADAAAAASAVALCGNCRIVTGTYTGSGTYNSSGARTLSFSGKPLAVFILPTDKNDGIGPLILLHGAPWSTTNISNDYYFVRVTWGASSVSWYGTRNENLMANSSGKTYYYVALLEQQ
jgi:hypothetical protein